MYQQSKFRWAPEQPMAIVLKFTRGRLVYDSPGDLLALNRQWEALARVADQMDDAIVPLMLRAKLDCTPAHWLAGLELTGFTQRDLDILYFHHPMRQTAWDRPPPSPQVRRALRGIPVPNPFSQVWELRQMRSLYQAAEDLLEDVWCDLVAELAPRHGWDYLAQLSPRPGPAADLERSIELHRRDRGEPGDSRRSPEQRY